jgi:outer membrane protein TolC
LPTALRLAQLSNPEIGQARAVVGQAQAALQRAKAGWLPHVNLGSAYSHHEGNIQKTEGNIITANRDSLFVGGGPSLSLQLSDALFAPLIARQLRSASAAGLQRVTNDTLLAVADAYFAVLRARRRLARVEEVLDYLTSEQPAAARAGSKGLLPLVRDFVEVGKREALQSDLARVEVEVLRRDEERVAAVQEYRVASAELARLLRLDPATPLWPTEDFRYPVPLPGGEWLSRPVEELVAFALGSRPELAETQALVRAALDRLRAARYRPLVPSVVLGYNWGDFGGSPDPNPKGGGFGPSGRILHFSTRTDFDVSLVWRLQNLGLGNRAEVREQEAVRQQAMLRDLQVQDRVVAQVVQTREQALDWRRRLDITRSALFDAAGRPTGPVFRSLRLNFERIRGAEGRPLEVLDSIRGLSDLLEAYGQAATDYERARFRLLITLGLPAQAILDAFDPPHPECPDHVPSEAGNAVSSPNKEPQRGGRE